jgi:hypothetical protein
MRMSFVHLPVLKAIEYAAGIAMSKASAVPPKEVMMVLIANLV